MRRLHFLQLVPSDVPGRLAQPRFARSSDPHRGPEPSTAVVGVRAVVPHKDATVATITIEGPTEFSDLSRRLYPTRSFRIEVAQLLKFEVFFFGQKLDTHGRRHTNGATLRLMFLSRFQCLIVVTKTYPTFRSLRRTINKHVLAGLLIL